MGSELPSNLNMIECATPILGFWRPDRCHTRSWEELGEDQRHEIGQLVWGIGV